MDRDEILDFAITYDIPLTLKPDGTMGLSEQSIMLAEALIADAQYDKLEILKVLHVAFSQLHVCGDDGNCPITKHVDMLIELVLTENGMEIAEDENAWHDPEGEAISLLLQKDSFE